VEQSNRLTARLFAVALFATVFFAWYLLDWDVFPDSHPVTVGITALLALYFLGCMALHVRRRLLRRREDIAARRQQTQAEFLEQLAEGAENAVLYLRPFKADRQTITQIEYGGSYYQNIEAVICQMVAGTPVAIGRPGEALPPRGAYRVYVPDDAWQEKVSRLLEQAKYVVLYVDFTPGVKWEIQKALEGYREKLILIPAMYNLREAPAYTQAFLLPLLWHSLRHRHFLPFFRKVRRTRNYYRQWNELFPFDLSMDDTVSAVIFRQGRAVPFRARRPSRTEQFRAIHAAIKAKLDAQVQPKFFRKPGERPLLTLCADLDMDSMLDSFVPFAQGQVEFYEWGIRYHDPLLRVTGTFNLFSHYHYRRHLEFHRDQLHPYADLREIRETKNGLVLVREAANGSSLLQVPGCHAQCLGPLKQLLEQARQTGSLTPEQAQPLLPAQRQQQADYARAVLRLELFGLLMGLLRCADATYAVWLLLVLGGAVWNITLLTLYGFLYPHLRDSYPGMVEALLAPVMKLRLDRTLIPLLALAHLLLSLLLLMKIF